MRLKRIKGADEFVKDSSYTILEPRSHKGEFHKLFGNENPINIEIGTGKGKFITSLAIENPNINYIGIEMYSTPLVGAIKRLNEMENPPKNLRFMWLDANGINEVFDHEVNKVYLNFSDPWPKKRHAKRRLTSPRMLALYEDLFEGEKVIQLKTDNDDLFDYSLESFVECGYEIIECDRDFFDKFTTEYEDKFRGKGKNINYVVARK